MRGFKSIPEFKHAAYEQVLRLIDTPILNNFSLPMMSTDDYEFLALLESDKDDAHTAVRTKWLMLPVEVPEMIPPDIDLLNLASTTMQFERVQFIYGVARNVGWNAVYASMVMCVKGVRFYAVSKKFGKSL